MNEFRKQQPIVVHCCVMSTPHALATNRTLALGRKYDKWYLGEQASTKDTDELDS